MSIGKSGIIKRLKFHSVRPNVGGIGNVNGMHVFTYIRKEIPTVISTRSKNVGNNG